MAAGEISKKEMTSTSNLEKLKEKLRASYERINRMQHVVSKVEICKDTLKMKTDEINDQLNIMATELCQKLQSIQLEIEQTLTKTVEEHLAELNAIKERVLSGNAFLMQVCMDAEGLVKGRSDELLGRACLKIFSRFEEAWQQLDLEEGVDLGSMAGIVFFNNTEEFLTKTYLASLSQVDEHGMVLSKQLFWVKKSAQTDASSQQSSTSVNFVNPVKSPNSQAFEDSDGCKQLEIIPEPRRSCGNQKFGTQKKKPPPCVRIRAIDLCQEEEDARNRNQNCEEIKEITSDIALMSHTSSTPDIADGRRKECAVTKGCRDLQKSSSSDKKSPPSSDEVLCDSFRSLARWSPSELLTAGGSDSSNSSSTPSAKAGSCFVSSSESAMKVASVTGDSHVQDPRREPQIWNEFYLDLEEDFVWESDEEQEAANKRISYLPSPSGDTNRQSKSESEVVNTVEQEAEKQISCLKTLKNNKLQYEGDIPDSRPFPGSWVDQGIESSISCADSSVCREVVLTNLGSVPQPVHKLSKSSSVHQEIPENNGKFPAQAPDINSFIDCSGTLSSEQKEENLVEEADKDFGRDSKDRLASKVVAVTLSQPNNSPTCPKSIGTSCRQMDIRSYMVHVGQGFFEAYAKCIKKIRDCFHFPIGVCTNSTGAVIVADTGNNLIRICQNGRVTHSFGQKLDHLELG